MQLVSIHKMCIPHNTISFHWITKLFCTQETILRCTEGSCENWGEEGKAPIQTFVQRPGKKKGKKSQLNMTRLPQGNCMYLCVLKDKVAGMTKTEAQQLTPP